MKIKGFMRPFGFILILSVLLSCFSVFASAKAADCPTERDTAPALSENVRVSSRLLELFREKSSTKKEARQLIVGGGAFGIKIKERGVTVTDASGVAGISRGDKILAINGKQVTSADEVRSAVCASRGESVTLVLSHAGNELTISVRPRLVDGEYKLGVSLRDSAMGIGTVTFVDPETGLFGGLGHGICDSETGDIIAMESGEISGVILGGINRGACGKPGELSGVLTDVTIGKLGSNTDCGVFGTVNPAEYSGGKLLEVGSRSDVHAGEATIISTLKNGKTAEYKIKICEIDRTSDGSKSFRIKVTDETLKALTGGIVRGMSGSPIIQDGKLVGAVTHVLVANPTEGYGIFIENMLNAAQGQVQPKAA